MVSVTTATPFGTSAPVPPSTSYLNSAPTGYSSNVFPLTSVQTPPIVRGNISTSAWGTEKTNQGGYWNHWRTAAVALVLALGVLGIGLCVDRSNRG